MSRLTSAMEPHIFLPNLLRMRSLSFDAIASVPVLFNSSGGYEHAINRYLRERTLAEWPDETTGIHGPAPRFLRPKSSLQLAYQLLNFLKYISHHRILLDWRTVSFDPEIVLYRDRQLRGEWAHRKDVKKRQSLDRHTVDGRVATVIDFLSWAGTRGYRTAFKAPGKRTVRIYQTGNSSRSKINVTHKHLRGNRPNPIDLRIPTKDELFIWLQQIYETHGNTKGLACETILRSSIRREECSQFPVDFLPNDEAGWHVIGNEVMISLTEGTKGGIPRSIAIPMTLAQKLDKYRNGRRLKSLAKWVRTNPGLQKPDRLFLSEYNGFPLSAERIYDAWKCKPIYKGWSPHLARHTWACFEVLDAVKRAATHVQLSPHELPASMIVSVFDTTLHTRVQPQLGHQSAATTRQYLRWLHAALILPSVYGAWHEFLDVL